jgi:acyl carrier protein
MENEEIKVPGSPVLSVPAGTLSTEQLQLRLVSRLAEMRGMDAKDIDITKEYSYYGLSSLEIVLLVTDLEEWLGRPLDPTLLWDYPTIQSFSDYLATEHLK